MCCIQIHINKESPSQILRKQFNLDRQIIIIGKESDNLP